MLLPIFLHPASTFIFGFLVALGLVFFLLNSCTAPNQSAENIAHYKSQMEKVDTGNLEGGGSAEIAALRRFTSFLQGIGNASSIRESIRKVYATDAYFDDTLTTHHGLDEIELYFIKTSEVMKSYQVTIDDVARSGNDYYIRWTMKFSAPMLSSGMPVTSVGISQIRFNREEKVAFHQDFWDSGKNFYAHLPIIGGAVGYVGKRLNSN